MGIRGVGRVRSPLVEGSGVPTPVRASTARSVESGALLVSSGTHSRPEGRDDAGIQVTSPGADAQPTLDPGNSLLKLPQTLARVSILTRP